MENCKDLDKLFGNNCIAVYSNSELSLMDSFCKENYSFDGEQLMVRNERLMFCNRERSKIKYIFAYQDGEFTRLYKAPAPRPIIQTGDFVRNDMGDIGVVAGDFVYYQSGGFDRLSSIMKSNSYITEIRRPNSCYGFEFYSGMPLIWPEKIKNNA